MHQNRIVREDHCNKHEEQETKVVSWNKLRTHIQANILPVIITMAQDEGHEVVFTPPYYSDLQPIEAIWAVVKEEVGCQYKYCTKQRCPSTLEKCFQ